MAVKKPEPEQLAESDSEQASSKAVPKVALLVSPFSPIFKAALEHLDRPALQKREDAKKRGSANVEKDFVVDDKRGARGALIEYTFGHGAETRRKWRHGSVIREDTTAAMLEHFQRYWTHRNGDGEPIYVSPLEVKAYKISALLEAIHDDRVSFQAFASMLGLPKERASQILDVEYFTDAPLLTDMYYDPPSTKAAGKKQITEADRDLEALAGYYTAEIVRNRAGGPLRVTMTLHVKYKVEIRQQVLLRTKLKIPYYVETVEGVSRAKSAVYDGWVRVIRNHPRGHQDSGEHIVWLFQKRRDRGTLDFEFFLTSMPTTEAGARIMKGRYLTLDQEGEIDSGFVTLTHVHNGLGDRPDFMDERCSYDPSVK